MGNEASSGHGGDFELVKNDQGDYQPNIEFTLPLKAIIDETIVHNHIEGVLPQSEVVTEIETKVLNNTFSSKVQFNDHPVILPENGVKIPPTPLYRERNDPPGKLDPGHPNAHPVQPHDALQLQPNDTPRSGYFQVFLNGSDVKPKEVIYYELRPTDNGVNNSISVPGDIGIPDIVTETTGATAAPAVHFDFSVTDPNTIVALVIYNFRILKDNPNSSDLLEPHPNDPNHTLKFSGESPDGTKFAKKPNFLNRKCYVYVVAARANDDQNDPQDKDTSIKTLPSGTLTINLTKLVGIMDLSGNPPSGLENAELYHTPANSISNDTLGVNKWEIGVTATGTKFEFSTNDVIFEVGKDSEEFHLGLYIFGEAFPNQSANTSLESQSKDLATPQHTAMDSSPEPTPIQSTLPIVNINEASEEELMTLDDVGPTRAGNIIAKRTYTSIEEIKNANDVGQGIFEKNQHRLTC